MGRIKLKGKPKVRPSSGSPNSCPQCESEVKSGKLRKGRDVTIQYDVHFGDEIIIEKSCESGECVPWENGETVEIKHMWKTTGTYKLTARVMDVYGALSEWSEPLSITMPRNKEVNLKFLNFFGNYPFLYQLFQQS